MVEPARLAHVRDEEVEPAVAVVVAPGRSLGAPLVGDAGRDGDVDERAVTAVVVEPAAVAGVARRRRRCAAGRQILAADEEVDQAVVVIIAPRGRLGLRSARPDRRRRSRHRTTHPPCSARARAAAAFSQAPRRSKTSRSPSLSKSARVTFRA